MQVIDQRGNVSTKNAHGPRKVMTLPVPFDIPEVPSAPMANLDPLETLELPLQNLVASVRSLLEERPIFTRRALINSLPDSAWDKIGSNSAKYMWQYCCYSFSSGPWRDAMVRFGVDPRKVPECRAYQTMMFMLESETKDNRAKQSRSKRDGNKSHQGSTKESHLFDGNTVSKDGKVWQVCDISDTLLKDLLATTNIRNECHVSTPCKFQWQLRGN